MAYPSLLKEGVILSNKRMESTLNCSQLGKSQFMQPFVGVRVDPHGKHHLCLQLDEEIIYMQVCAAFKTL